MATVIIIHNDNTKETIEGRVTAITSQSVIVHTSQGDIEIKQVKKYTEER